MWEPKDCCCCCSRKTGLLVLGGLGVAGALLCIINVLHAFTTVNLSELTQSICSESRIEDVDNCERLVPNLVMGAFIVHFVGALICLMVYSMLIHGVNNKISCLMVPSMVLLWVKIIIASLTELLILGLLISGGTASFPMKDAEIPLGILLVFLLLLIFFWTYILLVVRSHYREMRCDTAEDHRVLIEEPMPEKEVIGKGYGY